MADGKNINRLLLIATAFLTLFGAVMVFSASKYSAASRFGSEHFFLVKHVVGIALGAFALVFMSKVNLETLKKRALLIYIIALILLALVFVPGIGVENYGAKRWLSLGFFTIQPSDVAKFAVIILLSKLLCEQKGDMKLKNVAICLSVIAVPCVLIMLEPNMSITMCLGATAFLLLIVGGLPAKYIVILGIVAAAAIPVLILIEPYRLLRLLAFIDPFASPKGEGYQLIQSLYAVANGGLFGVGLFNSRQALKFLPFAESDFIFAIICEELGVFGALVFLLVYFLIFYAGIKIAFSAATRFEAYLAFGISAHIGVQVLINVAVVVGLIPPTGLPLPFVSLGNTQIILFMAQIGTLMNVSMRSGLVSVSSGRNFP